MKTKIKFISIIVLLLGVVAFTKLKISALPSSYVKYYMYHPVHNWEGISKEVKCNIIVDSLSKKILKVGVNVPLASFDSDNTSRDSHALEVMEALKYPKVSFLSDTIIYLNDTTLNISGTIKFHNVNKKIKFLGKLNHSSKTTTVRGKFPLLLTDFKITPPSLMMVSTEDKFEIEFKTDFKL